MYICLKHLPDSPVIDMVMALNSSSASLSWTPPPPYNCSLNYVLEIVNEENVSVVFLSNNSIILTTLMVGKNYTFRVASVYAAGNISNWSQPVSLAMQGLLWSVITRLAMNNLLCFCGRVVPAPLEIITATIKASSQMNYYISAEWKVTMLVYYKLFGVIYLLI